MLDFTQFSHTFSAYFSIKTQPNNRELDYISHAQKMSERIARIPGVRMIAICNSLSMYATHETSDIDFFIVTAPRSLWLVRIFANMILVLFGARRPNLHKRSGKISGKICLSFFCTTSALDFSTIAIEDDVYLFFWMRYLKVLIDKNGTYNMFLSKNNIDVWDTFDSQTFLTPSSMYSYEKWSIWDRVDGWMKKFFLPRTLRSYTRLGCPEGVVISGDMLKFHDQDRRQEIRDAILKK